MHRGGALFAPAGGSSPMSLIVLIEWSTTPVPAARSKQSSQLLGMRGRRLMRRGVVSVNIALRGAPSEEFLDMCDYSLHMVRTRPAKVGEKIITHDFGTGTRVFAAPEDCSVAVCLLPGTELAFEKPVKYQATLMFRASIDH